MLVVTKIFSGSVSSAGAVGSGVRAASAQSHNLSNLGRGALGVRGFSTGAPPTKDLKSSATPGSSPDGGLLKRFNDGIEKLCKGVGVKYEPFKLDTKEVFDILKHGPLTVKVDDRVYMGFSKEGKRDGKLVDASFKLELKGGQVTTSGSSVDAHVGKASVQGGVGSTGIHGFRHLSVHIGGDASLLNARGRATGLSGLDDESERPFLKLLNVGVCKAKLLMKLEKLDLQDGTRSTLSINLSALHNLSLLEDMLDGGMVDDAAKVLTIEKKIVKEALNQTYHALLGDFGQRYREMEQAGVLEQIDALIDTTLGGWRSDGEGWSPEAMKTLGRETLASQVLTSMFDIDKHHGNSLPIHGLAQRLLNDYVDGDGKKL